MNNINTEALIKKTISKNSGTQAKEILKLGKGASGSVYCATCESEQKIAVKISGHPDLMLQEFEMLKFLKEKTASKIPCVYFFDELNGTGIIAMEYINGINGTDKSLKYSLNKRYLAESIVNNLLVIHEAHNDSFGPYNNATFNTWQEYYKLFADRIYDFSRYMHSENKLDDIVMYAVELSYNNFDRIFYEDIHAPTLIHGDYWMPNFIIDKKSMELLSVVDPFNVMWADPEYELFAMTVGFGKKLHLYELYKSKVTVSKHCDLKLEMYALYSELLWYNELGEISHSYLKIRSKNLTKQMKKHGII